MKQSILLMNDLPGYGRVALSTMMPVLSRMGYELYNLPTALVSNTLNYGSFEILDTTEYMKKTIQVWEELKFQFQAICTGFIASEKQRIFISDFCKEQKKKGTMIIVDPIMGDGGKLYHGISLHQVDYMRELCATSDLLLPNMTESCFLTDHFLGKEELTTKQANQLLEEVQKLNHGSVVITSAFVDGNHMVLGYDKETKERFSIPFDYIKAQFPGTGDLFCAILSGNLLKRSSLKTSTQKAMKIVQDLLIHHQDDVKKYNGIPIEQYFEELSL